MFKKACDSRVAVFFADGLEEVEGLAVVDLLFRAGIPCDMVSISGSREVTSSHEVHLTCHRDIHDEGFSFDDYAALVLPGGIPGTPNLRACEPLCDALRNAAADGRLVCAVCAAPSILAELGLLDGRAATSYPSFQQVLAEYGAHVDSGSAVVVDGNLVTSQGMGAAIDFGLAIIAQLLDEDVAARVRAQIVDLR
ncbi:DJ-1 family glyoxalase III [Atopobiaceae bacterium SGI.236]|nr:DJ-1 family glyoxalase III [Atopobiaceae bacterium]